MSRAKPTSKPAPTSYDAIPYPSDAFPQTDPRRLHCLARLFGLEPAATATARVLELGCASGGNLLPMAARLPGARFVGVDASIAQVDEGKRLIKALDLGNVTLGHGDIAEITSDLGEFDYIICHGVYSWVPTHVQDAILRVCRENLAKNGVAYVSYNTYPGWKTREVVRDAMLFHTRDDPFDLKKLARARGMLEFMQKTAALGEIFGKLFEQQRQLVATGTDSYVMHEFLETHNQPCYFHEFVNRLGAQDLAYLTDADTFTTFSENYGAAAREALIAETGGNQVMIEQYLDFCSNRSFRQSLFIHQEQAAKVKRQVQMEVMREFHLRSLFVQILSDANDPEGPWRITTRRGATLTAGTPFLKAALQALMYAQPGTVSWPQWLEAVKARLGDGQADIEAALSETLVRLVVGGHLDLFDTPLSVTASDAERPKADPFLRRQSAEGLASLASLHHETIRLNVVEAALLPKLDGQSSHEDLVRHLVLSSQEGRISFLRDGKPIEGAENVAAAAREHVAASLSSLHAKAALI